MIVRIKESLMQFWQSISGDDTESDERGREGDACRIDDRSISAGADQVIDLMRRLRAYEEQERVLRGLDRMRDGLGNDHGR